MNSIELWLSQLRTLRNISYITWQNDEPLYVYLIDLSPLGLFRPNEINNSNKLNLLKIPTGRRQTSWLCTSAAEELNQALPGTNPAGDQGGTWTWDLQISSLAPNHSATLPPLSHIQCTTRLIDSVSIYCDLSIKKTKNKYFYNASLEFLPENFLKIADKKF